MNDFKNAWLKSCFGSDATTETVHAVFQNGSEGDYPISLVSELQKDDMTVYILDNQTGELIYDTY